MSCNDEVHHDLALLGEDSCPLCDECISCNSIGSSYRCCADVNVCERDMLVCINCGVVHSSVFKSEYVDFYSCMFKVRRKSVYRRKYHLDHYVGKMGFELTCGEKNEVLNDFDRVVDVLGEGRGKRYPMFDYLFYKIFEMRFNSSLSVNYGRNKRKCERFISAKTIDKYDSLWSRVCEQNGWSFIKTVDMVPAIGDDGRVVASYGTCQ